MRHRTEHTHHPSHPADSDPSPSHPNAYTTDAEGSTWHEHDETEQQHKPKASYVFSKPNTNDRMSLPTTDEGCRQTFILERSI